MKQKWLPPQVRGITQNILVAKGLILAFHQIPVDTGYDASVVLVTGESISGSGKWRAGPDEDAQRGSGSLSFYKQLAGK